MLGYTLSLGLDIFNFFRFDFNFGRNKEFSFIPLISKKLKHTHCKQIPLC
jgi:hypothetical protein